MGQQQFAGSEGPLFRDASGAPLIHRRVWRFNPDMVDGAPELPGVYALWQGGELVFYGCAGAGAGHGIRSSLKELLGVGHGRRATHYSWEVSLRPYARHVELLNGFWWAFHRFPRGNETVRVAVLPPAREGAK